MVEKCEFTVKLVESGRFIPVKDDELIQLWTGVSGKASFMPSRAQMILNVKEII